MEKLIEDLNAYLFEVTGLKTLMKPLPESRRLPAFLDRQYSLYELKLGGQNNYVGVLVRDPNHFRPSALEKHLDRLIPEKERDYCLIASTLPSYVRKRLLERRIPFVVPWSQMYLPTFGMEHRQRVRPSIRPQAVRLSPATQVIVISALLGMLPESVIPSDLSRRFNYTAMTMTRVLHEIESLKLGAIRKEGRERLLSFPQGRRELWERAQPKMHSPTMRLISIMESELSPNRYTLAGESALAIYSQLNPPSVPVYAVSRKESREILEKVRDHVPPGEEGSCLLQVWRYDPALLSRSGYADPFSLFLSLQDTEDERIRIALDELMENRVW